MTSDTYAALASSAPPVRSRFINRRAERVFFGGMSLLICAVVFIGFFATYFGAGVLRAPLPSPVLHIHGALFTLWIIVYLVQTALISAGRVLWHRTLGIFAFCLTPLMFVLGVVAALDALRRKVSIGPLDPAVSLAIPLLGIVAFAILIAASWSTRRDPASHKRLILLATVGLADAALGRFPWDRLGLSPAAGAVVGLGVLIALLVGYDLYSLRRLHRSTLWAAPFTFAVGSLSVPVGMTPGWHAVAAFLERSIVPHLP